MIDETRVGQVWMWRALCPDVLEELYLVVKSGQQDDFAHMIVLYSNWREELVGDRLLANFNDPWFFDNHVRLL